MKSNGLSLLALGAVLLNAAACSPDDAEAFPKNQVAQAGLNVRDSAGISIVEVSAAFMSRLPVWRIGSAPVLSIGSVDGDEAYLFDGIKRTSVARLTNGSLAIVDGSSILRGTAEIRIFDSTGRYLRRFGRKGEGPGEFSEPPDIRALPGGGVLAANRNRIAKFDASGKMLESFEVPLTTCPERCSDRGALANGTIAVYSTTRQSTVPPEMAGRTIDGLKVYYGQASRETTRVVATINMPPHKALTRPARAMRNGTSLATTLAVSPVLTPSPESGIIAGQDHFAVTLHDPHEFRVFNSSAKLIRIIRITRPRTRVTDAEKRALIATSDASNPIPGRVVADYWPEFDYVRFGDNDDLWVQDYHRTTGNHTGPVWFTIIGNNGVPLARLDARTNPIWKDQSRAVVHQAPSGRNAYRVITRDSLDVQRLLVFPIIK